MLGIGGFLLLFKRERREQRSCKGRIDLAMDYDHRRIPPRRGHNLLGSVPFVQRPDHNDDL